MIKKIGLALSVLVAGFSVPALACGDEMVGIVYEVQAQNVGHNDFYATDIVCPRCGGVDFLTSQVREGDNIKVGDIVLVWFDNPDEDAPIVEVQKIGEAVHHVKK